MNTDQSARVASAYRTLGLLPVAQKNDMASRAFAKYRHRIVARNERLASIESRTTHEPSTDTEADVSFPFMLLPPELRNRVYQYALAQSRRLHLDVVRTPCLACTCQQIRHECLPVFLRVNSFQTYYSRNPDGTFGIVFANETLSWLKTLPLTTKLIQDLRITVQGDIIDRGPRSSKFQIVNTGLRTFVSHFDARCPFCIDGWYGEHFVLPHPIFDSPAIEEFREDPFEMKKDHDMMVSRMEEAYFRRSKDWGRGGLSISEVIDLAYAASAIYEKPVHLQELYDLIHDVAEHVDQITLFIDYYIREKRRERLDEAGIDGDIADSALTPHREDNGSMDPDSTAPVSVDFESRGSEQADDGSHGT